MEEGGTRQQILVHAARLFGRHGYHGTTTREIADAVGIRQPSLFYHFSAKHVILSELVLVLALFRCVHAKPLRPTE